MTREVIVCHSQEEIFTKSADMFVALATQSIAARGQFTIALSGGSTPKGMYLLLASDAYRDRVDWNKVQLFWGDERSVSPDNDQSNYRMANQAMISKVPIPAENVHRMKAESEDIELAAKDYENILKQVLGFADGEQPKFDLILLGMGDDGHTASLFPGTKALAEKERIVVVNWVEKFNTNRMTFTAPAINNARNIVFMAAGANKLQPLKEVLVGEKNPELYPSQLVQPTDGKLIWLVDEAATGGEKY
ncbi:MAG: 6-phosphogluconolactonase [Acidobacteria bacterium]|nr:6-phosphogluconolactonase [Acidobacteriota bacterium]